MFCDRNGGFMNTEKKYALDNLFIAAIIFGVICALISIFAFEENETWFGIIFGIMSLFLGIFAPIFTPYCYAFDGEGVSLCYIFLPVERYLWNDIYEIKVDHLSPNPKGFDYLFLNTFKINGVPVGGPKFYMKGHIAKSLRTKRLLESYWDGTITGYLFESTKKQINKRKSELQSKVYSTDEIQVMENEVRAEAEEWLKPLIAQAKQYDLDVRPKYYYINEDFDELEERPQEEYTYTLIAEISHFNETDEDRIVLVSADLLFGRLGQSAYRGVKNKELKEELLMISENLDEIIKEGIEIYCKNQ